MNIVYVADSAIPSLQANSIQVMQFCDALAEAGHRVTLLHPGRRRETERAVKDISAFYGVRHGFRRRRLPFLNVPGAFTVYGALAGLYAALLKADLVYGRSLAGCAAAAACGRRTAAELHVAPLAVGKYYHRLFGLLLRCRSCRTVTAVSRSLAESLAREYGLPAARIRILPSGAPHADFAARAPHWPGRPGVLQAGYLGHLYPGKGMEIVAPLAERMPDADFHVAGGDTVERARWGKRSGPSNLMLHGFIAPGAVSGFLNRLDVCLLPLQQRCLAAPDRRGRRLEIASVSSPLKLFQYMAHRKPIIASDLPVLRETLNERNAWLAPADDPRAWQDALRALRADPTLARALACRAYADFERLYSLRERVARLMEAVA